MLRCLANIHAEEGFLETKIGFPKLDRVKAEGLCPDFRETSAYWAS